MSTTTFSRRPSLTAETVPAPVPPRKRLWRWWLPVLGLLLLIWFLPAILARTPVVQWTIDAATADLKGRIAVDSVSLGWFSPIRLRGTSLDDERQQRVLEVSRIESERTLFGLLLDRSRLGTFKLVAPRLALTLQDGTSNIEQILAEYLKPSDEPASRIDLALEIVDGSVAVTDVDRGRSWKIDAWTLALRIPVEEGLLELVTSGTVADPQQPGRFDLALNMPLSETPEAGTLEKPLAEPPASDPEPDRTDPPVRFTTLRLDSEAFPLALFEPLLRRFSPDMRLGGFLNAEVDAAWGRGAQAEQRLKAKAQTRDFHLATATLGSDQMHLAHLMLECDMVGQGRKMAIHRSLFQCDLGEVALVGSVDLDDESLRAMPRSLADQVLQVEGTVDLAQLAAMLPSTLQLRPEMKVTSGQVQFAMESARSKTGMTWQGELVSTDLKALDGGREIVWDKPVLLTFAAHQGPDEPPAGEFRCQSEFLKLHAAGTAHQFDADVSFNLDRLAEQVGQFIDLGPLTLAGEGWSHATWQQTPEGAFQTEIELHLSRVHVALPDRQPWQEPELIVFASASGQTDFGIDTRVEAASFQVAAGDERIEAKLLRPVLELRQGGTWPVALQMTGELAHWPARLALLFDTQDYPMAGQYQLAGQVTASRRAVEVTETTLKVESLALPLSDALIVEPQAQLDLAGSWNSDTGSFTFEQSSLRTTSFALATNDLSVTPGAGGAFQLAGTLAYQGHLGALRRCFVVQEGSPSPLRQGTVSFAEASGRPLPRVAGNRARGGSSEPLLSWRVEGRLTGTTRFECTGDKTIGVVEAEVENLQIAGAEGEPFHDPHVKLTGRGAYDAATHAVVLDGLTIESTTATINGQGSANMSGDEALMQFGGQLQYDMQQLSALFRPYVGTGVELIGRHSSPLTFAGPLDLQRARASGSLAWQQGEVYGFLVGPGELKMKLAEGALAAEPLAVSVSQGRMQFQPTLHLAPGPMTVTLEPGPLATQVHITPPMCASALKFIAPVLAGVTAAQGAFSIELDRCRVPVDNVRDSELAGRFIVHSVEIGPGPLIRELAILLEREAPARLRRESVVPFHLAGGRVQHDGLELIFPDVTIRTQGSVGLDQTLSLTASLPIPSKWLTNDTLRRAFQGQEIAVPIAGTLSAPRLDRRELDRWNRRLLENAAQNVIRDQLDRGLDRLFRPR